MCICHTDELCPCYRGEAEWHSEQEVIARASVTEHEVLSLLRGECEDASPRATAFVTLLRSQPESVDGADVADVLVAGERCYWWTADGEQHHVQLNARAAIRLAA
jgi:hypothetical protein